MTTVERKPEDFVIDAALLAAAFGLTEPEIKQHMRDQTITTRCETGIDDDAGRWRLTFFYLDRACRFTVDAAGQILKQSTFTITPRPQDAAASDGGNA